MLYRGLVKPGEVHSMKKKDMENALREEVAKGPPVSWHGGGAPQTTEGLRY
jgi:hypothetical protein